MFQELDAFGLPISLFYYDNKIHRKSSLGAIATLIMVTVAIIFTTWSFENLRNPEAQQITQSEFMISLADKPEVDIHDF